MADTYFGVAERERVVVFTRQVVGPIGEAYLIKS